MAATLVGGAFLSATVQTLVEKLASSEFRDYLKNTKLNVSLLRQLQTTLLTLQAVLDDAEEKQIKNHAVKQWLDDLKDAVFDAEDLLKEIDYDSLRCKVESTHTGSKTSQVLNFFSSPFNSFYANINSQMKVLWERLHLFAEHKDILDLKTVSGRVSHRTPSSSVVNESVMVGREDDKERLVNMLLSERDRSSNDIGVVAIWGMDTFTALEYLSLRSCPALRSLPQRMDTLTSLEHLTLYHLPKLELSFSEGTFLPSNLRSLDIQWVGRATTPVTEWGLQRLTALSHLTIEGHDDIVKTLLKERLLPNSLVGIRIHDLSEMKSIEGSGIRHLTSLESLRFVDCSVLEPFLEDTFPSSLKELRIRSCPLLEAGYGSESGEHWSNIAHIPVIVVNDKVTI